MKIHQVHTNKKKFIKTNRFWAGFLLAQFLLFYILSKFDIAISVFEKFFEVQKNLHQKVFSIFPFSVGDLLYILAGIFLIYFLFKVVQKKSRKSALKKLLVGVNIFYFLYQLFWGMLYFQPPLLAKLSTEEITLQETKALTLKYLDLCKNTRTFVQEDSRGIFKIEDLKVIETEILQRQKLLPEFLISKKDTEINSFKPSLFKGVMSFTGILGYYNPFTAEAQYNAVLPATYLPYTLAHESSHQLGYAREQEANFIGFLLGRDSKNEDLKYSTQYFVLKSLLRSLAEKNPEFVKEVLANYSQGMKKDREAEIAFVKAHEGFLEVFFGFTNDLFLKSNQQDGSITYSYFVDLLVRFERNPVTYK